MRSMRGEERLLKRQKQRIDIDAVVAAYADNHFFEQVFDFKSVIRVDSRTLIFVIKT